MTYLGHPIVLPRIKTIGGRGVVARRMTVRREGSRKRTYGEDILDCGSSSYRLSYFGLAHLPYEPKAEGGSCCYRSPRRARRAGACRVRHMGE